MSGNDYELGRVDQRLKDQDALKCYELIREKIEEEKIKQVGSCDTHDTEHCPDCEKWFLLQYLVCTCEIGSICQYHIDQMPKGKDEK